MLGDREERKGRGRPKSDDPKMEVDKVRLKTSSMIDLELIADHLDISVSELAQTIFENEIPKYKKFLKI